MLQPTLDDLAHIAFIPTQTAAAAELECEAYSAVAPGSLLPSWHGLLDLALDSNPFLSPEFLVPTVMHQEPGNGLSLVAVWRRHKRSRELVGLFPVERTRRTGYLPFARRESISLWSHASVPLGMPLLTEDAEIARQAIIAFVTWIRKRKPDLASLCLPGIDRTSQTLELLATVAPSVGATVEIAAERKHTRGLDLMLADEPLHDHVTTARDQRSLLAMLEQLIAIDAVRSRDIGDATSVVSNVEELACLRAITRGLCQTGRIIATRLHHGSLKAGALAIVSPTHAYLWRMFGPSAHDPAAEAAIAWAIRGAVDKPVVAATQDPIAGICVKPLHTVKVTFDFG